MKQILLIINNRTLQTNEFKMAHKSFYKRTSFKCLFCKNYNLTQGFIKRCKIVPTGKAQSSDLDIFTSNETELNLEDNQSQVN